MIVYAYICLWPKHQFYFVQDITTATWKSYIVTKRKVYIQSNCDSSNHWFPSPFENGQKITRPLHMPNEIKLG